MQHLWKSAFDLLQLWLDQTLALPLWLAYALLGLALIVTLPGRHGMRPLNAALLGFGLGAVSFFGLRALGAHEWLPGLVAVPLAVTGAVLGLFLTAWGTAFSLALCFAVASAFAAHALKLFWAPAALLGGCIGLFVGQANQKGLAHFLPPLFASFFTTLAFVIGWASHDKGAKLYWLLDVRWALLTWAVLFVLLFAAALEREHQRKRRLAARTKRMEDDELKTKIARQKEAYQRSLDAKAKEG